LFSGGGLQCTSHKEFKNGVHQGQDKNYMPGEVLVRFKKGITEEEIHEIAYRLGMKLLKTISTPDYLTYRFKLNSGLEVTEAIKRLKKLPDVIHVQPNYIYGFDKSD
jgi:hypothetical protein